MKEGEHKGEGEEGGGRVLSVSCAPALGGYEDPFEGFASSSSSSPSPPSSSYSYQSPKYTLFALKKPDHHHHHHHQQQRATQTFKKFTGKVSQKYHKETQQPQEPQGKGGRGGGGEEGKREKGGMRKEELKSFTWLKVFFFLDLI